MCGDYSEAMLGIALVVVKPLKLVNKFDDFFDGTRFTPKVLRQMKQDDFHGFPSSVEGFQGAGKKTRFKGGDGIMRDRLEIPGSYKGKDGVFEYIREPNGDINHRYFRQNRG